MEAGEAEDQIHSFFVTLRQHLSMSLYVALGVLELHGDQADLRLTEVSLLLPPCTTWH